MSEQTQAPTEPATVFVISPIGEVGTVVHRNARNVLEYIVKKALPEPEYQVVRADDEAAPDSITAQIVRRIVESDYVVADLSDRNANVFYELAVAHGFSRPVVHLMVKGQQPPFDVQDQRVIFYDLTDPASVDAAREGVQRAVEMLAGNSDLRRNPVTDYRQFEAIERSSTPAEANEALVETLTQIQRRLGRIESRQAKQLNQTESVYPPFIPRPEPSTITAALIDEQARRMNSVGTGRRFVSDFLASTDPASGVE